MIQEFVQLQWFFPIALVLEALLALLLLWITGKPAKLVGWFALANLISMSLSAMLLLFWTDILMAFSASLLMMLVVESIFLSWVLRKHFRVVAIAGVTFALNLFSSVVGLMLYMMMAASVSWNTP